MFRIKYSFFIPSIAAKMVEVPNLAPTACTAGTCLNTKNEIIEKAKCWQLHTIFNHPIQSQ